MSGRRTRGAASALRHSRGLRSVLGLGMLAASVLPPNVAAAGDPHQVPKIDGQIRIDGVLDEPAWQDALVLEIGVEVEPVLKDPQGIYGAKKA